MNDMNSLYVIRSDGSTRTIPIASNVLENIMDATNIGAIFRSAAALKFSSSATAIKHSNW